MKKSSAFLNEPFVVSSPNVSYTEDAIEAQYSYNTTLVTDTTVQVIKHDLRFHTQRRVPKLGVMLIGWGGNNGSTFTAGLLANKSGASWSTKEGIHQSNYFGSLTQSSTVRLGLNASGESVYIPFQRLLPSVNPNDIMISGE